MVVVKTDELIAACWRPTGPVPVQEPDLVSDFSTTSFRTKEGAAEDMSCGWKRGMSSRLRAKGVHLRIDWPVRRQKADLGPEAK